jgi:protein-tyrosine phosphatase
MDYGQSTSFMGPATPIALWWRKGPLRHWPGVGTVSGWTGHDVPMRDETRLLPLVGASNFRDLGGYPTTSGRPTCWGRLFRSDTLHELTEADVAVLRDLGLKTVIDLRTTVELQQTGRGLMDAEAARFVHLSVIDKDAGESRGIPAPIDDDLSKRYLWYLDIGRDALVGALTAMGEEANYPMVFHCAAGKDRTGVLSALVLEIAGVDRDTIVEDYVLTASRMELIVERLRHTTTDGRARYEIPAKALAVEAVTMRGFLEGLDRQHGGARQWALSAGVPPRSVDAMAELLTAG